MKTMIREETWPYIEEYLRSVPEVLEKIPAFQEALVRRELRARQQTLVLLLQHKFGAIPDAIRAQIDRTMDLAQLDQWLLQVMDRNRLAEIQWGGADRIILPVD